MAVFDISAREGYYGTGILVWAKSQKRSYFAKEDLETWNYTSGSVDPDSEKYFSEEAVLAQALRGLESLGALSKVVDRFGPTIYVLQSDTDLEKLATDYPDSAFSKARAFGIGWMKQTLLAVSENRENPPEEIESIVVRAGEPQSETWEPLPLSRTEESFAGTVDALDSTVAQIASDNGFASTYPAERDNLIDHAKATLKSARDGKVTALQIRHHLIGAGRWLIEKFGGTAIGALGSELVKLALRLMGWLN